MFWHGSTGLLKRKMLIKMKKSLFPPPKGKQAFYNGFQMI
ncbi:hypothetical protein BAXH7_00555 [Bacillus amyloliquefaciens XH7]|nr:hypothetical protein BAXH7_00555 [Bacillus amyloliquefaciens XH7]KYC93167.1 hypothetical protein B425_0538 [Bacillus amyloliquefaciens]